MTKRTNPRKDFTQVAFSVVQQATGEAEPAKKPLTGKKAESRKGGLKGGKWRMDALTPEQRKDLAKKAVEARWGKTAPAVETGAGTTRSVKQR
ncbi:MAG: histone H1 [Rhodocyclaceae bacterium]|nr:MAG: histone H1 [Rhodocyclaceae bacterium]